MSETKVVLAGYSGHGIVVAEAALLAAFIIQGYSDKNKALQNPYNLRYLGFEDDEKFAGWNKSYQFILGIGDNLLRKKIANRIKAHGQRITSVIHPLASVSSYSKIGAGTFIARNVAVNPLANIGCNVILNTSSTIEHECLLNDFVHIAPGAVLAGNVTVEEGAFIGANAVIKQGVKIGSGAIIGAGAVVLQDVDDSMVVVGNPGKLKS